MRLLATLALGLLLAGCFGMCGPTITQVSGSAVFAAGLDDDNRTAVQQALQDTGFTLAGEDEAGQGGIVARRDGTEVSLRPVPRSNRTEVVVSVDVPDREFDPDDGGNARADAYGERMVEAHRAEAQAVVDLLAEALGVPPTTAAVEARGFVC